MTKLKHRRCIEFKEKVKSQVLVIIFPRFCLYRFFWLNFETIWTIRYLLLVWGWLEVASKFKPLATASSILARFFCTYFLMHIVIAAWRFSTIDSEWFLTFVEKFETRISRELIQFAHTIYVAIYVPFSEFELGERRVNSLKLTHNDLCIYNSWFTPECGALEMSRGLTLGTTATPHALQWVVMHPVQWVSLNH